MIIRNTNHNYNNHDLYSDGDVVGITNGKQEKMTTVNIKISLSEQLHKEAEEAGLLSPQAIERLLREEIRRRRVDNLFAAADRLAALDLPPLTDDDIAQEIRQVRKL